MIMFEVKLHPKRLNILVDLIDSIYTADWNITVKMDFIKQKCFI